MAEVKRYDIVGGCYAQPFHAMEEAGDGEYVEHSDYARLLDRVAELERERDELAEQLATLQTDAFDERQDERAELTRLRAVEAAAQGTRNRLEAVERAVGAVSEAMMMRADSWKASPSAKWAGDALALFAVSLAEACGRKG